MQSSDDKNRLASYTTPSKERQKDTLTTASPPRFGIADTLANIPAPFRYHSGTHPQVSAGMLSPNITTAKTSSSSRPAQTMRPTHKARSRENARLRTGAEQSKPSRIFAATNSAPPHQQIAAKLRARICGVPPPLAVREPSRISREAWAWAPAVLCIRMAQLNQVSAVIMDIMAEKRNRRRGASVRSAAAGQSWVGSWGERCFDARALHVLVWILVGSGWGRRVTRS